jgi:hypothetical protein
MSAAAKKPSAANVARWVAILSAPLPEYDREGRRELVRAKEKARGQLASWGLGADGSPAVRTENT